MNSQNQRPQDSRNEELNRKGQDPKSTQQTSSDKSMDQSTQRGEQSTQRSGASEINEKDQQKVAGGSGLLSGGNDLGNALGGSVGLSNSSSGSNGDRSYTSNDDHNADFNLGQLTEQTNF